jgi:hypothetical protein
MYAIEGGSMTSPLVILKYGKLLKLAGLYTATLAFCVVGEYQRVRFPLPER